MPVQRGANTAACAAAGTLPVALLYSGNFNSHNVVVCAESLYQLAGQLGLAEISSC